MQAIITDAWPAKSRAAYLSGTRLLVDGFIEAPTAPLGRKCILEFWFKALLKNRKNSFWRAKTCPAVTWLLQRADRMPLVLHPLPSRADSPSRMSAKIRGLRSVELG